MMPLYLVKEPTFLRGKIFRSASSEDYLTDLKRLSHNDEESRASYVFNTVRPRIITNLTLILNFVEVKSEYIHQKMAYNISPSFFGLFLLGDRMERNKNFIKDWKNEFCTQETKGEEENCQTKKRRKKK